MSTQTEQDTYTVHREREEPGELKAAHGSILPQGRLEG